METPWGVYPARIGNKGERKVLLAAINALRHGNALGHEDMLAGCKLIARTLDAISDREGPMLGPLAVALAREDSKGAFAYLQELAERIRRTHEE